MAVSSYRDLIAWKKAMELVVATYRITESMPRTEIYGLTNQMRRAAVSIPSNIAEGQGRGVGREFVHHLRIANGSRQEPETQLLATAELKYLNTDAVALVLALAEELGRILRGLTRSLSKA